MQSTTQLFLTKSYWKSGFRLRDLIRGFMGGLGSIYVLVKLGGWLAKDQVEAFSAKHSGWLTFATLLIALGFGIYAVRPRRVVSCKLANRDVKLSVEVGDLFSGSETVVIGTNRTFDTEVGDGRISPASAQGQFTQKYYTQHQHLDADLARSLAGVTSTRNISKTSGKQDEYPIGTVATVQPVLKGKRRRAYLVAVAELNNQWRAQGTMEGVKTAASSLWTYIGEQGDIEPIRVPILGTGYSRLTQQRSEIVRELLKSFVAACADKRFCESLTIVISFSDYRKYDIDLEELGEYLTYLCKYTELRRPQEAGTGAPLNDAVTVAA